MQLQDILPWCNHKGVDVPHQKSTAESQTINYPLPAKVFMAMSQHIGPPCTPTVKIGDYVKVGQIIGDSPELFSVPVHSSVSGTVKERFLMMLPGGKVTTILAIETDGQQLFADNMIPPTINSKADFLTAVRDSGLVGLGGSGFPTHLKLNPPNLEEIDTLLINGAECEPYITTDYRECMENSEDIIFGIQAVLHWLQIPTAIIGIEDNKPQAIEKLGRLSAQASTDQHIIKVKTLPCRYPQGAEKILIKACLNRKAPPGGLPAAIGCLVMNVTSVAALARYLKTGIPLIARRVTVDGSAIANPQNLMVPIGTMIQEVIDFCGIKEDVGKILMGGPMMGHALMDKTLPVLKQNNAITALNMKDATFLESQPCIRCGRCIEVCPMNLMPTTIIPAYREKNTEKLQKLNVMVCMECGCCSFSCPAHRKLVQTMQLAKNLIRQNKQ